MVELRGTYIEYIAEVSADDLSIEDGGRARILRLDPPVTAARNDNEDERNDLFVRLQSWHDDGPTSIWAHQALRMFEKSKKIRVRIEIVE